MELEELRQHILKVMREAFPGHEIKDFSLEEIPDDGKPPTMTVTHNDGREYRFVWRDGQWKRTN